MRLNSNTHSQLRAVLSAAAVFTAVSAHALTITPIYDVSFNSAALQTTVNNALAIYTTNVANNQTIAITFKLDDAISGAESSYTTTDFTYLEYRTALAASSATANDVTVLAGLGLGTNDPVIGGANISVPPALALILGLSGTQANYGTVTFNKTTYEANPLGFLGTIQHEVNEVLGTASSLPNGKKGVAGALPTTIAPPDLFRFSTNGTRNFTVNATSDATNRAFFRLSSGGADQQEFNNLPNGGDYADWAATGTNGFAPAPQDQAGDSSTFTSMAISPAELTMLDAIGYNAFPVPEPGTLVILGATVLGSLALRRNRRVNQAATS